MTHSETFTPAELRLYSRFRQPIDIQRYLDDHILYNREPHGETCYSPRLVIRHKTGHCMEGALFAATALEFLGHPPRIVDLTARNDYDHVVTVFQHRGRWGAIAKSNYSGIRYREPVYATIRELAMSYFEHFFNRRRERTLRGYSRPVLLTRFDALHWRTTDQPLWDIPYYLHEIKHFKLLPARVRLTPVDPRTYRAGLIGHVST